MVPEQQISSLFRPKTLPSPLSFRYASRNLGPDGAAPAD